MRLSTREYLAEFACVRDDAVGSIVGTLSPDDGEAGDVAKPICRRLSHAERVREIVGMGPGLQLPRCNTHPISA